MTAGLLLIPLLAMLITSEVNWGIGDFMLAGALLFGSGAAYELAAKQVNRVAYRFGVAIALGASRWI